MGDDKAISQIVESAIVQLSQFEQELKTYTFKPQELESEGSHREKLARVILTLAHFFNENDYKAERNILLGFNTLFGYPNLTTMFDFKFSLQNLNESIKGEERREKNMNEHKVSLTRRRKFQHFLDRKFNPEFKTTSKEMCKYKEASYGFQLQDFPVNSRLSSPAVASNLNNRQIDIVVQLETFKKDVLPRLPRSELTLPQTTSRSSK